MSHSRFALSAWLLLLLSSLRPLAWAEKGILTVNVTDPQGHPVRGLQIGLKFGGGSDTTVDNGTASIPLALGTNEHSFVMLQIVSSPPGRNLALLSPYDSRVEIPPFENKPENFVNVTVVELGDRVALADGKVVFSLISKVNQANAQRSTSPAAPPQNSMAILEAIAKQYGYTTEELLSALKSWKPDPNNLFQLGQKALFDQDYAKASEYLGQALAAATRTRSEIALSYGLTLRQQGRFAEAAAAYDKCLEMDPFNSLCLNNKGEALAMMHQDKQAVSVLSLALQMKFLEEGPQSLGVAACKTNLGALSERIGDYRTAETLYNDAWKIISAKAKPNDPSVADLLNDIGGILENKHDYTTAEQNYRRALQIDETALGKKSFQVAIIKNNLATVLRKQNRFHDAETIYREALSIDEETLPPNSLETAIVLNNLASLRKVQGDSVEAAKLYKRSVEIKEKVLPPDSPVLADGLANQGRFLLGEQNYSDAEPLFRRALDINKTAYRPPHPKIALSEFDLGVLLKIERKYAEAESLLSDALSEDEKVLGPNDPTTRMIARSLDDLRQRVAPAHQ